MGKPKESGNLEAQRHWIWTSWRILALGAACSFALANLFISKISTSGISSVAYFNSGALLFALVYFIVQKEWSKRNVGHKPAMGEEMHRTKVLTRKWETNDIDWLNILVVMLFALF